MIDLTNYDIEMKKALTQKQFEERIEKGFIKSGDIVDVYDNYANTVKTKYVCILPPSWISTIKDLQKENWQNKRLLKYIYTKQEDFWAYMKRNNIIPEDILNERESEEEQNGLWKI